MVFTNKAAAAKHATSAIKLPQADSGAAKSDMYAVVVAELPRWVVSPAKTACMVNCPLGTVVGTFQL